LAILAAQFALTAQPGVSGELKQWYDPRFGGDLQDGSVRTIRGGAKRSIGAAPKEPQKDWAVLVRLRGSP